MRQVRGYDVMMSLGDALRGIMANDKSGKFITSADDGSSRIAASFDGSIAASDWSYSAMGSGDKERVSATVSMPRLHSGAELTRHQADMFVGFGVQELSKALFEESKRIETVMGDPLQHELARTLENFRTERSLLQNGMAPNARKGFESVMDQVFQQQQAVGYTPNDLNHIGTTLALMARERAGYTLPYVKDLKREMGDRNLKILEEALDKFDQAPNDRSGTKKSIDIARWIMEQLDIPPQPPQPMKNGNQQGEGDPQEGEGEGEGSGEGEGQGEGQGEGEGDGSEGDGKGNGSGQGDGQGKGDAGKDGKGQGQGDGKQGQGKGKGNGDGKGKPNPRPNPPGMGKGGRGYSKPNWHRDTLKEARSNFVPINITRAMRNASEEINKVSEKVLGTDKLKGIKLVDEARVPESFPADARVHDMLKKMVPAQLGNMRHALWRLLQSKDEHFVDRFREFGRWDQRAMTRMLAGKTSLYKLEADVEGMKTCISIILDLSGSMSGGAIQQAASTCLAFSEVMEQLSGHGVVYEILGFCDTQFITRSMNQRKQYDREMVREGQAFEELMEDLKGDKKKKKKSYKWWSVPSWKSGGRYGSSFFGNSEYRFAPGGSDTVGIIAFKGFNQKLAERRNHIAAMVGRPDGGTPDGEGLMIAIKDVIARPEPNKIVMVLTDGMGDVAAIKAECAFAEQLGVDVIGVGIGRTQVQRVYPISITAENVGELGKAMFSVVVDQVRKNREKYFRKAMA